MTRPLVVVPALGVPGWAHRIGERVEVRGSAPTAEQMKGASSLWIDGALDRPLEIARSANKADPTLQVGVVAADEDRGALQRAMIFTPGVGELWIVSPREVEPALLERAAEVTRKRRSYRSTREHFVTVARGFGGETRAVVTDAFLAALLEVLPDPVLSVDEEGRVVSWSAAATRVTGRPSREAVGRPVRDLLRVEPPQALSELLEAARQERTESELRVEALDDPERLMQAIATPVTAAGIRVRALVLRDLTEERRTQERLREHAAALDKERTAVASLAEERDRALRELQKAVDVRSRFFTTMSHEIRTPINAILGYNDLLIGGIMGAVEEKQLDYLKRSQSAARHLLELVNDILDLSKLEAGKIDLKLEPVKVGYLMEELTATIQPLATDNDTPLEQDCEQPQVDLETDPRRVRQILLNLVSNAVKFGEQKPISLRCYVREGQVCFEVADRGPGIAAEDLERIFEEFAQVGGAEGGTGLGLPISRRLAELLGGELTVRSTPGEGSTFTLRLPRTPG